MSFLLNFIYFRDVKIRKKMINGQSYRKLAFMLMIDMLSDQEHYQQMQSHNCLAVHIEQRHKFYDLLLQMQIQYQVFSYFSRLFEKNGRYLVCNQDHYNHNMQLLCTMYVSFYQLKISNYSITKKPNCHIPSGSVIGIVRTNK